MRWLNGLCLVILVAVAVAPPPNRQAAQEHQKAEEHAQQANQDQQNQGQKPLYEFAYQKYLEQVVKILESDPKFNERLRGMKEEDIKSGKIADHIEDLGGEVFDKLHKAKLEEIERLREEIAKQIEKDGDAKNVKVPDHIDVADWQKFGKEDLRKLIVKTVSDMDEIDRQRREQFKEYEMQKQAEEEHRLAQMTPEEREKAKKEHEEQQKRHNEHEKLKHPGSRDQLEEVWEDTDHMDKDNYDPKTFFALHDLNGDGFWNEDELEALFQIELEKVYNETNPDDDPRERVEEMYRMREHVVKQMDKNNDRLISLEEFLQDQEAQTPGKDEGWEDLANQKVYTEEELKKFEEEYAKQKGWGDHPYDPVTQPSAHLGGADAGAHGQVPYQQQQQQHQPPPPPPPPAQQPNAHVQPPQQPVQPQQVHVQTPEQVVPQQPVQPQQVHAEVPQKVPKAVDPVYGI
ncbi:Protein NUCB-1 b [Aphelenchoides avenae]|nr:Protein NUCB-1 b [Aphelenchus avenae]